MYQTLTVSSSKSLSRLISIFIIISLASSFKVNLDKSNKEFKVAIETSIHHPIADVLNTDNTNDNDLLLGASPHVDDNNYSMISVFDDTTFSPFTPTLENMVTFASGKYQYIASSLSSTIKFNANKALNNNNNDESISPCEYIKEQQQYSPFTLSNIIKQEIKLKIPQSKRFIPRKTFVADDDPSEYWFHNKIHSFGNTGFLGAVHAACAPIATKLIDLLAYDKINVRSVVSQELAKIVHEKTNDSSNNKSNNNNIAVLDLCCGIGMSTNALNDAFMKRENNAMVIGLDTSPEMIETARGWTRHEYALGTIQKMLLKISSKTESMITKENMNNTGNMIFARGNAERTIFPDKSFNLVTIMYAFHEVPSLGRYRILREVRRILQNGGTLALIDISPEYQPSPTMLSGEPYVLEYQRNIEKQMKNVRGFTNLRQEVIIPGHVNMWLLDRKVSSTQ